MSELIFGGGSEFLDNTNNNNSFNFGLSDLSLDLSASENMNINMSESDGNLTDSNSTVYELPIDMTFNDGHILSIVVYSILFIFGASGNIKFLTTIKRYKYHPRLNRLNMFLLNLAIADLLVTFLLMPLEISWAITVSWKAGDLACRILSFFRTFGLYLSGFILICISLDCYFAVLKPLSLTTANRRGRIMLWTAWIGSIVCSLPQVIIFHVEKHPIFPWYEQCVTFNFFSSKATEMVYNAFGFIVMYALPLVMIIFCYGSILCEVIKVSQVHEHGRTIRISNIKRMGRAKVRTLKLTVTIVVTFFLCWTPYNIMSLWYWIDKDSAYQVDQKIQKGFFLFAVANSCFNPLVYGYFNKRKPEESPMQLCENNNNRVRTKCNGHISTNGPDFKIRATWKKVPDCLKCQAVPSTSSSTGTKGGQQQQQQLQVQQINYVNESQKSPNRNQQQQQLCQAQANGTSKPFYLNPNFHNSMPIMSSTNMYNHNSPVTLASPSIPRTNSNTLKQNPPKKSALAVSSHININIKGKSKRVIGKSKPFSSIKTRHVTFPPNLSEKSSIPISGTPTNISLTKRKKSSKLLKKTVTTIQVKVDMEQSTSSSSSSSSPHCSRNKNFDYFDQEDKHRNNELQTHSSCV